MTIPNDKSSSSHELERFLRGKLRKLCLMRFDTHFLPDDADGRGMLTALLRFDLTDDSAAEAAPWCATEIPTLKRRARRMKWRDVGKLIGLTFDEWKAAKLYVMRPVDATEADLEAWREQRRKESSRKSKQKARAKEREQKQRILAKAKANPPRQAAILEMLTNSQWPMTVSELTKQARKSHAFRSSKSQNVTYCKGPPPHQIVKNLPYVVRRTIKQLEAQGAVQTRKRAGKNGPEILVFLNQHTSTTPISAKVREKQMVTRKTGMSTLPKIHGVWTAIPTVTDSSKERDAA